MIIPIESLELLRETIGFTLLSALIAFILAPFLIKFLYKFNITRNPEYDATLSLGARRSKAGTPIMGGLLVIVTVFLVTYFFNWERSFTWMPIVLMLWGALLGGIDDLLNTFNKKKRRNRKLKHVFRLIRVHKSIPYRIWLIITLPWAFFKRSSLWLGSHPGRGLHVHERILMQFLAGAGAAYWVYFKLADHWREIHIPFDGFINIGWWIIPLIILFVMATANAVNVADGMDGLAGGSLVITFAALTLISWVYGYNSIAILNATALGALIPYTYFNIKPARFQMGDVGSLSLGVLLAVNVIVVKQMLLLPLFGFIFYVELLSVLIQVAGRHVLGRRIFKMAPLHHHFELRGWGEEKTVMRFWMAHVTVVLLGVWIALF